MIELDQIKTHLSSTSEKRRPTRLSTELNITFYARTHATLFRIDQEQIDFYGSWFAMIDSLSDDTRH